MITTDTLIVGGGLSGLAIAEGLQRASRSFLLLDARNRLGGRILTHTIDGHGYDLGPAWFWPGQPLIEQLVSQLELTRFEQFSDGLLTAEDSDGAVQYGHAFAAMAGAWRLQGGLAALTNGLAQRLPTAAIRLEHQVIEASQDDAGVHILCHNGREIRAQRVIFAMPPRLIATIKFSPALPEKGVADMTKIPTWMAGQAKALAIYKNPFWRDDGLSGDAMSHRGPMVEVHDASPFDGSAGALFGFIGVPARNRRDEAVLTSTVLDQLTRLFGPQAAEPEQVFLTDWAKETHTAVPADQAPLMAHPTYGAPPLLEGAWSGKLHFAGTEFAPQTGGFLEGALEAAQVILDRLPSYRENNSCLKK